MGKIKGWTDVTEHFSNIKSWANSTREMTTHIFIRRELRYNVLIQNEYKIINSVTFNTKREAIDFAIKYMKSHPRG